MKQFFDANYTGPADSLDGASTTIPRAPGPIIGYYGSDYRMLLLMGVRANMPGADTALQWLMNYTSSGETVLDDIDWRSGYALAPLEGPELIDPPVIGAVPADPVIPDSPDGSVYDFTVTAVSPVDGPVPTVCVPASHSLFPVGTTLVTCTATDSLNHSSAKSFMVTVLDGSTPGGGGDTGGGGGGDDNTLHIVQPEPLQVVEGEGPWGIVLQYDPPVWHFNATSGVTTCSLPPGSTFPLGTTRLYCSATVNGQTATVFTDVLIIDTKPPTVSVTAPVSGVYLVGQSVPVAYTCADTESGVKTCVGNVPSGGLL